MRVLAPPVPCNFGPQFMVPKHGPQMMALSKRRSAPTLALMINPSVQPRIKRVSLPHLEVRQRTPRDLHRPTPLLFVHGAYVGAWCWDEHFLPWFAERGYRASALSLRGHGDSSGRERLNWLSLRDYVADLEQVVATLPRPPVLIGHSMGGLVVQKYLERHQVPAVVLLAPVPPSGLMSLNWWVGLTRTELMHDLWLVQAGAAHYASFQRLRDALFSRALPDAEAKRLLAQVQGESQRALWDMNGWDLPRLPRQLPPSLVIGAGNDALVPRFAVAETARALGCAPQWIDGMAHIMMLDPHWEQVATRIDAWLLAQGL